MPLCAACWKRSGASAGGEDEERKHQLSTLISGMESVLADDGELEDAFQRYMANLPLSQHPQSGPEQHRMFSRWEDSLKRELEDLENRFGWTGIQGPRQATNLQQRP